MSAEVLHIDVVGPASQPHPRIVEAVEQIVDSVSEALAARRERLATQKAQEQLRHDIEAARCEAYALMRDDPRMGADLLAAVDRHEAMFLSDGAIAR